MIKKIVISVVVIAILLVAIMQVIGTNVGESKESFLINGGNAQAKLISELKQRGIRHEVDSENRVWFDPNDRDLVHNLANSVMLSSELTHITIRYNEPEYTDLFERKLVENGISYEIVIIKGEQQLRLSSKDEALWGAIKQDVDKIVIEEAREKLLMDT